jgi:hypothetical protein
MITAITFIKRFFHDLFSAIRIACFDYDAKLQIDHSPLQRLLIWGAIFTVTAAIIILLFFLGSRYILSFIKIDEHIMK